MIYRTTLITSRSKALLYGIIAACMLSAPAYAKVIGTVGAVYPILEKDAQMEMQEKASKVNWQNILGKENMEDRVKNFQPRDSATLPPAKKDRVRLLDMTYTLEFDIKDEKGNIVYPKGFQFNPIDYINVPIRTMVVIDSSSQDQINWYLASSYAKQNVTLMVTSGKWYEMMKITGRPVYYLPEAVKARFQLESVPSVIQRNGSYMEVREFYVEQKIR